MLAFFSYMTLIGLVGMVVILFTVPVLPRSWLWRIVIFIAAAMFMSMFSTGIVVVLGLL